MCLAHLLISPHSLNSHHLPPAGCLYFYFYFYRVYILLDSGC